MNTEYIKDFYCYAMRPQILKRSAIVAVIVGTILNMINQGDAIGSSSFNLAKCLLTYTVPFCVATYGSVSALIAMKYKPESLGSCEIPAPKTSQTTAHSTAQTTPQRISPSATSETTTNVS